MRTRGLTLSEVLIAIAVIIAISGITFAVIGGIRGSSNEARCYGHLRTIHQSMMIYRADYSATMEFSGGMEQLGLPYTLIDKTTDTVAIATREDWICPSPKPAPYDRIWPQYKYVVLNVHAGRGDTHLTALTEKYRGSLPLAADLWHNDFSRTDLASPVAQKKVIFVNLDGELKNIASTRSFSDPSDISAYGFSLP